VRTVPPESGDRTAIASALVKKAISDLGMHQRDASHLAIAREVVDALARDLAARAVPFTTRDGLTCRVCVSDDIRAIDIGPTPDRVDVAYLIVCLACGAVFTVPERTSSDRKTVS
jgi:hypothetical protein